MKCLDLKLPDLENTRARMLVDKIPSDHRFEQKGNLYFSECEGLVRFYAYQRPDEGFGGRTFTITMKDGSTRKLHGPWSSGSYAMNTAMFTPSMEVSLTDEPSTFKRGYTFWASAVTVAFMEEALKQFHPDHHLVPQDFYGDTVYKIRKRVTE